MSHPQRVEKVDRQAEKRAIEVARYVLPVAAATTMVHTLSGIVLHRLWRMQCGVGHARPRRARSLAKWSNVCAKSTRNFSIALTTGRWKSFRNGRRRTSVRRGAGARIRRTAWRTTSSWWIIRRRAARAGEAYRAVVGVTEAECPDAEALDRMLNPARNPYRLETLNVGVHAPLMRPLQHANFTFAKKISHTADSQDQRHRMVPGSRPLLVLTDTRAPDFITPMLIRGNARATEVYERAMADAWAAKNDCSTAACPRSLRFICCPMPRRFGWSNRARCCICCTSGPCAPASTRRRRSTRLRWKRSPKCARRCRSSGAYRSAMLRARRRGHAGVHGGFALLRHQGLAGVQHRASAVTRHGTVAYYLAAWAIGSSSVAIMLWIISTYGAGGESPSASIFLRIDFLALIFGAPGAIAFAFLLRT